VTESKKEIVKVVLADALNMAPQSTGSEMQFPDDSQSLTALTTAEYLEILQGQSTLPWTGELDEELDWTHRSMPDLSLGTSINFGATLDGRYQQNHTAENFNTHQTNLQQGTSSHSSENTQSLQCFEHGCNGRVFSCRENYLRHVREKSGKSTTMCLFCGTEFTRRSNRDKHVAQRKCWQAFATR
jgi:hypothetical protein